jgi:hypothetical protein
MTAQDFQGAPTTVRLVFEYEDDNVQLVSQVPVDVPPTVPLNPNESLPGEYVEVRSQSGETIGRVRVHPPITTSVEIFPEDHGEPIVRTDLPQAQGAFTVVVAAPPRADHVIVFRLQSSAPSAPGGVPSEASLTAPIERVELGTFELGPR